MNRPRSRSRERIIAMAVQAQLHRLPQDQRRAMQTLRNTITSAGALAQLGCLVKIIRNVTDQALQLDLAENSTDAFVLQSELTAVKDKIQELEQATTLTTQATMEKADQIICDLVMSPDGSPYPMSEAQIRHPLLIAFAIFSWTQSL